MIGNCYLKKKKIKNTKKSEHFLFLNEKNTYLSRLSSFKNNHNVKNITTQWRLLRDSTYVNNTVIIINHPYKYNIVPTSGI